MTLCATVHGVMEPQKRQPPFPVVVSFAPPPTSERNMFLSDWRHSMRESPFGASMPASAYRAYFDRLSGFYLGRDLKPENVLALPPGVTLLTLRKTDRPSYVVGWLLLDRGMPGVGALVYVYVKKPAKHYGYAALLLSEALGLAGEDELVHAIRPREWVQAKCDAFGFPYRPIEDFIHAERSRRAA